MENFIDEYYVVNPNYVLRHDEKRSIIVDKIHKNDQINSSDNFYSFIHPYHAEFLSLFNGSRTVYEAANHFSFLKKINLTDCVNFISKLIENKNYYEISICDSNLYFPQNLLVKKSNCDTFHNYDKNDFSYSSLDFKTKRLHFPLYITYMVNTKCTTDCIYCYADCRERKGRGISKKNLEKLFHEIDKYKLAYFNIMGGEFFLDNEWEFIVQELIKIKVTPIISTKMPISNKIISILEKNKINEIQISLDSINPSVLKKLLKLNGEKYIEAMKQTLNELTKANFRIKINSVITKYNDSVDDVKSLLDFLSEFSITQQIVIPAGFTLYKPSVFMPSVKNIQLIKDFLHSYKENYKFSISLSDYAKKEEFFMKKTDKENAFNRRALCTGNINQIYILPNGDVTLCEGLMFNKAFIMGNVNNKSLKEIWDENKCAYLMNQSVHKGSICGKCIDFESCHSEKGVCWKLSILAYGDENFHFPDPRCPKAPKLKNKLYIN